MPDTSGTPRDPEADADEVVLPRHYLGRLDRALQEAGLEVEFYFVSGSIMAQAFTDDPESARLERLLRPSGELRAVVDALTADEAWPEGWLQASLEAALDGPGNPYVDLERLRAFRPVAAHVLALKCASRAVDDDEAVLGEIAHLIGALDIDSVDEAMKRIRPYFAERQLPEDTRQVLERQLA